jgi:hypothetical protein
MREMAQSAPCCGVARAERMMVRSYTKHEAASRMLFRSQGIRAPRPLFPRRDFVEELLDQWYGPSDVFFKVRADDGNRYILRNHRSAPKGAWSLESFREVKPSGGSK